MTASSSLRQRRGRRDDEENTSNNVINTEDDEMELFAKHYKQATTNNSISQCQTVLLILIGIIILALTLIILQYNPSQQTLNNSNSSSVQRQDLKLITIYPHYITSQIHTLKSQTELLITDSNKEAINAIRIGIAMSNNLHYHHTARSSNNNSRIRKRKKRGVAGILLGISNFITSLRSSNDFTNVEEEEGYIPGDIVLVAYDEIMIRNYLVDFGGRCSSNHSDGDVENGDMNNNENTILNRYDEISTLIQTTTNTDMYKDMLWNQIIQLFTLCQFINNEARGYIAFNTTLSKSKGEDQVSIQERLEESRLNGVGMVMKESDDSLDMMEDGDDSLHYASLFVIPKEEAARDEARKMLHKRLEEEIPSLSTTTATLRQSKSYLLLEISDGRLHLLLEISDGRLQRMELDKVLNT